MSAGERNAGSSGLISDRKGSATAAQMLSQKILDEEPGALDTYMQFLSTGRSKYPVDILKDAGVDMTTSQPFEAAMREMNRIMDEMERIYARGGSTGG